MSEFVHTLVVGSGAAGLAAAVRLKAEGIDDVAILTEGLSCGTSINTGSDKQTYYKLGMYGAEPDSPEQLARTFLAGGAMHGDLALVEAALSPRCFFHLVDLGVPFPRDAFGQFIGYKTDHDPQRRATGCGPYTSRDMCRALIAEVGRRHIRVIERHLAVSLLTVPDGDTRRAAGVMAIGLADGEFSAILAENVVFATGGPGGLYRDSVYPAVHTGGIGVALAAGVRARNLPESQFGLASTAFRWNVSGSYMQVLPRFLSTDENGGDEREFLADAFGGDGGEMNSMIFLKGYQWPFDAEKAAHGSSRIDLAVHRERIEKCRRVFLDYRRNSPTLDFAALAPEARDYLERSGLSGGTPVERLKLLNAPAYELYREHGIDLEKERLEIAVCAQHNNGGLAGNHFCEAENLRHFFPIGEVNGSHGIRRPGGSALNAGQAGAFRAAEFIAARYAGDTLDRAAAEAAAAAELPALQGLLKGGRSVAADRRELQARMSDAASHLRRAPELAAAVAAARRQLEAVEAEGYPAAEAAEGLRNYRLILAQLVYLEAILFQVEHGVGSRGSALVLDEAGRIVPEDPAFRDRVLESEYRGEGSVHRFAPCRPLPASNGWFETVWKEYREGGVYER